MPTKVNDAKLGEWKRRLPKELHTFLENFLCSCEPYDPAINYLNYLRDIEMYWQTDEVYGEHFEELVAAFHDIIGSVPHRTDE